MVNNGLKHLFQLWYRSKELLDGQIQTKFANSSPTYNLWQIQYGGLSPKDN